MAHDTELTQGRIAIPVWERYTLSIEEAAVYFRIGENELRRIISETGMRISSSGTATGLKSSGRSLNSL